MIFRAILILALAFLVSMPASSETIEYPGYTEYDGRSATLILTFNGLSVTGKLDVDPVCEESARLTGVHLDLSGMATGPWEDESTSISGDWAGGDLEPCSGNAIQDDPSYPNEGSFTISIDESEGTIRLVRMPTGYGYKFKAKGVILSGSAGSGNPDLKITEISVPSGIGPGMNAEITVTFGNEGSADAGPFSLYGYAIPSQDYKKMYQSDPLAFPGLGAGETASASIPISISSSAPAGTFDVKVAIDNSNYAGPGDVLETNENNNEMWKRKVSGAEAKPAGGLADLAVTEVRFDPNQEQSSDKLTFIMGIKNLGGEKAEGFNAGFYLSTDMDITTDDIYIGYGVIDLEPGESKSGPIPCDLPETLAPGLYYIGVIADPLQKLAESDETNNAMATDEPIPIPSSLTRISSQALASSGPGSQSETVYLMPGQTHTYQMPSGSYADGKSFGEVGILSLAFPSPSVCSNCENFVKWSPAGVLSGDGEEILGTGTSITLTALKEGTATVRMTAYWQASRSDGQPSLGYQDFTWNVVVGKDYVGGQDKSKPPSSSTVPAKKGEITSGKIRGRAIYRPTGEPVAGAAVHSIDFQDESKGGYPVGSGGETLKTASDGSFEIDIAKWVPSGLEPGRFWIRIIKPYEGYLTSKVWDTSCQDLWVVQSPLKTFTLDKDSLQAGAVNAGVIEMDKAFRAVPGMECPVDPETGGPIEDAGWP